ncbi:MAG: tetratricopeptide repeat protein [Candidatus Omnitrophica bacterium]|nr:tetratricopeptide repeat protein [Candidatus Omnitrophota bacterium]
MRRGFYIIAGLGLLVYINTFFCSFQFDDTPSIIDNHFIKNISDLQNIWNFWPCRFITYLSFALNYHLHGLNVFGYHLFNLSVHLASGFFVWWLVLLTFSSPFMKEDKIAKHAGPIALFAGLVFVAHPMQTEAVTYIVQRAASMAALFYLASLSLYVKSRLLRDEKSSSIQWKFYYIAAALTAIAAMFTKEIAITLPLMILLYEFSFLNPRKNSNWKYMIPFLFAVFIIPATMLMTKSVNFQEMHRTAEGPASISPIHYLFTQFRVMVTYVRFVFLPINQNIDYDYPVSKSFFEFSVLSCFFLLIIILFTAKRLFLKYRLVSFSIFWFFLTLLPESSIFPIQDVIFEHRLYLPLAGYSIFLVSGVYYFWGRNNMRGAAVLLTIVTVCYSVLTCQRNKVWKDEIVLWDDAVRKSPHKARAYNNRGNAYGKADNLALAMSDFKKAVELDPDYADAYYNRGVSYGQNGNFIQAMSDYSKAIEKKPNHAQAYYSRGVIYDKHGDFLQAISDYNKAVGIKPDYADAFINLGAIYAKKGNFDKAILEFTKAIEAGSKDVEVYEDRGSVYAQKGNFYAAMSDFTKAIEIKPSYAETYYDRGVFYYHLEEYDKAWVDVHKAQDLGGVINPQFIKALKQASGREE